MCYCTIKPSFVFFLSFRKRTPNVAETPGSARRVLDSIERSFNKVRHVLTPRKQNSDLPNQPQTLTTKVLQIQPLVTNESKVLSTFLLQDLCNVSTTECGDPEVVITKLTVALESRGISCQRKGLVFRNALLSIESL